MSTQGFKINEKTAKTAIVGADITLIGDSEVLVSGNMTNKKATFTSQLAYYQANLNFTGANIKYLTSTDSPYTITDSDGDGTFICDTSTADINIIIPTLADNQNRDLEFIHQTGGNTLNIDGEGAETIDGLTDIDLPKQGDRLKIKGTTSEWSIMEERISCQLRLDTYAGYGSTDTKIMQFTNSREDYGNMFTHNHGSYGTAGLEITIVRPGKYSFAFSKGDTSGGTRIGLSKNSSQLSTNISSINATDRMIVDGSNSLEASVAWSSWLDTGAVIRPHTIGVAPDSAGEEHFTVTYAGN